MAIVTARCGPDGEFFEVRDSDGQVYVWEQGQLRVQDIVETWEGLVRNQGASLTVELGYRLGGVAGLMSPADACTGSLPPDGVALVSVTTRDGLTVRMACDALEYPGGPGAIVAMGGGGVVPSPLLSVWGRFLDWREENAAAAAAAFNNAADLIDQIPTPAETVDKAKQLVKDGADAVGDALGRLAALLGEAAGRGVGAGAKGFLSEAPPWLVAVAVGTLGIAVIRAVKG